MTFNDYLRPVLIEPAEGDIVECASRHLDKHGITVFGIMRPLLDGTHSTAEVYAKMAIAGYELQAVSQVLESLDSLKMLTDAPAAKPRALTEKEFRRHERQVRLFDRWLGEDPAVFGPQSKGHLAQAGLKYAQVMIVGLGAAGSSLAKALAQAGVGNIFGIDASAESNGTTGLESSKNLAELITAIDPAVRFAEVEDAEDLPALEKAGAASLLVYCPDHFDRALCVRLNELALSTPVPFLIYRPTPFHVEIGPLIFPGETACFICCELRRQASTGSLDVDELLSRPSSAFDFPIGVDILALEALKVLAHIAFPVCRGRIWRLNLRSGLSEVHPVLKLPRCVACGNHRKTPPRKLWNE